MVGSSYDTKAAERGLEIFEENSSLVVETLTGFMRDRLPRLQEASRVAAKYEVWKAPAGTELAEVDYKLVVLELTKECLERIYQRRDPELPLPSVYPSEYVALEDMLARFFYSQFKNQIQNQLN